ncbi:MAG: MAPEG family protein [Pseudomonadaceae bacterium]|jgi:hypothetical protein|nr:MAPEG family protein [Pseudomonadaceae bacterium]
MERDLIFLPVAAQVMLTLLLFIRLGQVKARASSLNQVDENRRALHKDAWPDYVLKVTNNIENQFQTPVLFYVLSLMAWALDRVDWLVLMVAWTYIATRLVHAGIHLGANVVLWRRKVFSIGVLLLLFMTLLNLRTTLGL